MFWLKARASAGNWPMAASVRDDDAAGLVPSGDLAGIGTVLITVLGRARAATGLHRRVANT